MIEGWHNQDYLILFESRDEALELTEHYGVGAALPGGILVGLKSWDDFIIQNAGGQFFTLPTVPIDVSYASPFSLNVEPSALRADQRFVGKIKWYVKPIIFGGNPSDESNIAWISLEEHIKAVKWWNQLYRDLKQKLP